MNNNIVLFILRRDIRFHDNVGLHDTIKLCKKHNYNLMICFSFTTEQTHATNNKYFSKNAYQFMIESLKEIKSKLSIFNDKDFYKDIKDVRAICFNRDYTPYAIRRDKEIEDYCIEHDIKCHMFDDYLLFPMNSITTSAKNTPYTVFTPFYRKCLQRLENTNVSKPKKVSLRKCSVIKEKSSLTLKDFIRYDDNKHIECNGGRKNGLVLLKAISSGKYKNYKTNRNIPSMDNATTKLSAYLKFGCLSIREVFHTILNTYGLHHDLIKQLIWKEFYAIITFNFGDVVLGGMINRKNLSFNQRFDAIEWSEENKTKYFDRWCSGTTGVPIVDAGMRQLNTTGYMHNRLRMITASFLVKDLLIDWREGERYFATKLVDYDPASNNGGWQWVAGTGTDAAPYFRVFNPWLQMKKFDKKCLYVKKWIHELKDIPCSRLLDWDKHYRKYSLYTNKNHINYYPEPIISSHEIQKQKFLIMFNI